MKLKVGDFVAPKHSVGKIVEINDQLIRIEIPKGNTGDFRYTELTKQQAQAQGLSLTELIKKYIIQVAKI